MLIGCLFDLPISMGELALEEHTRPIKGALSMAMATRDCGLKGLILPRQNAPEAAVVSEIEVIPVDSLTEAVGFFAGSIENAPHMAHLDRLFEEF